MKIALLGIDPESLPLLDAAARLGHSIVWCSDPSDKIDAAELPLADDSQFRELFDSQLADVVIVGVGRQNEEVRVEQIKELVKAGQTLLLVHPVTSSVLAYHEIDLARTESEAVVQIYNPLVATPAVEMLRHDVGGQDERLGPIEQIVAERRLGDRSRPEVLWHFARDVQLLAKLGGRFDRLGSHGIDADDLAYGALAVQLAGPSRVPVRWSVAPGDASPRLQVTLIGQRGRIHAEFDEHGLPATCELVVDDVRTPLAVEAGDPAEVTLAELARIVKGKSDGSNFLAALEAMELTDTIEISLRRGRMIDVHHQQLTEELAFKGTMSAVGCGALLVLPPLMLAAGWLAEQLGIPLPIARSWALILGVVLALFVALQALPKLFLGEKPNSKR